ncbi:hypothetical protein DL771_008799 [Monosporascus sp. 5C6A]|nr:hypothetical protein DL771_008799 [Monosporascus sp. 5C6A]
MIARAPRAQRRVLAAGVEKPLRLRPQAELQAVLDAPREAGRLPSREVAVPVPAWGSAVSRASLGCAGFTRPLGDRDGVFELSVSACVR